MATFKKALEHVMDKIGIYAFVIQWWDLYTPINPGHYRHVHVTLAQTRIPVAKYAKMKIADKIRRGIKLSEKEINEEDLKLELKISDNFSIGKFILMEQPYFERAYQRHLKEFGYEAVKRNQIALYRRQI